MKRFKIRLEILTPTHIGTGEVYEPLSFFVRKDENALFEVDFEKFCELITKNEEMRNKLISYARSGMKGIIKLYRIFEKLCNRFYENGIGNFIKRKINIFPDFVNHYYDLVNIPDEKLEKLSEEELIGKFKRFEIHRIAISQSNEPYIPGSSLKGSIRTAVLNLRKGFLKRKSPEDYKENKTYDGKRLERDILNYEGPKDDPFKSVKISDLFPVNSCETEIVYAVNRKKTGERASGPYQMLEVIREGAIFEGILSLESSPNIKSPVNKKEIEEALKEFYGKEFKNEIKIINKLNLKLNVNLPEDGIILRIGRHSGAECITIEGFRRIKVKTRAGFKILSNSTTIWLASEDRRGFNLIAPFGWAKLTIFD